MYGLRFGLACRKQPNSKKKRAEVDPEDEEYKEAKNARKKFETPLEAAMPCKMETRKRFKELRENCSEWRHSPTQVWNVLFLPRIHDDRIAERGFKSLTHYNLVHNFIPIAPIDENSGCKRSNG